MEIGAEGKRKKEKGKEGMRRDRAGETEKTRRNKDRVSKKRNM